MSVQPSLAWGPSQGWVRLLCFLRHLWQLSPHFRRKLLCARPSAVMWVLAGVCGTCFLLGCSTLGQPALGYDEGVYWQTLRAMASGHSLYSSVFMSQPPFFALSIFPIYALLGQSLFAARAAILLYSILGIVAIYAIGRAIGGARVGLGAAVLLASDSRYTTASVTLRSDLPALVLALVGIALALEASRHPRHRRWLIATSGGALGLALMTKLLAVVALVPVALTLALPLRSMLAGASTWCWPAHLQRHWSLRTVTGRSQAPVVADPARQNVRRSQWWVVVRRVGADMSVLSGMLVGTCLAVLAPYLPQWHAFYQQVVGFHIVARSAASHRLLDNLPALFDPMAVVAIVGLLLAVRQRHRTRLCWLLIWLGAALLVLLLHHPLFSPHVLVIVAPLAVLAAYGLATRATLLPPGSARLATWTLDHLSRRWGGRRQRRDRSGDLPASARSPMSALLGIALVGTVVCGCVLTLQAHSATTIMTATDRALMVHALDRATRPIDLVVTDDQYVAALAGRSVPPDLVDTSFVRISTAPLTATQVEETIQRDHVRAVLFASGRLDQVVGLRAWTERHFELMERFRGVCSLYVRS
jgi:hypothetical protein